MASSFMFMGMLEVMMLGFVGGGQGLPLPVGLPPTAEDPKLSHVAPTEKPLIYITWAGTADADATSANHTERILADPQVKHLFKTLEQGITGMIAEETKNNPQEALLGKNIPFLIKGALFNPATIYIEKFEIRPPAAGGGPEVVLEGGFIVNMGKGINDAKKSMDALEGLITQATGEKIQTLPDAQGGLRKFPLPPGTPSIAWGVEGNYLIFALGDDNIKRVRGALKNGRTPKWLSDARTKVSVERTSSFTFVNGKIAVQSVVPTFGSMIGLRIPGPGGDDPEGQHKQAMAMFKKVTAALGLDKLNDIAIVTGFDKEGFVSKTLVDVDAGAGGLFKLVEGKPLTAADLDGVPADADLAYVTRIDPQGIWAELLKVIAAIDPNAVKEFKREMADAEEELGFKIKDDLIDALGDTLTVYNSPGEGGLVFTGLTGVVKLKDSAKAKKVVAAITKIMDKEFNGNNNPNRFRRRAYEFKKFDFMGESISFINPIGDDWVVAPAWCVTKDSFIIAPFPQMIKGHLARKAENGASIASQPKVKAMLASSTPPLSINYVDMKSVFPKVYAAMHPIMTMGFAELQSEGFKMDMSSLPAASSFSKHLDKSTGFVARTNKGIYMESRGRLPLGGVGTLAPVMLTSGMMMPMMMYRNADFAVAGHEVHGHDHGDTRTTAPRPVAAPSQAARRAQSMNQLRQIGVSVFLHHAQKNKAPDTLDELGARGAKLKTDPWGKPYVYLGKGQTPGAANSSKVPIAATSHLVKDGHRLVLYGDGHVELISDTKFKAQCAAANITYPKPVKLSSTTSENDRPIRDLRPDIDRGTRVTESGSSRDAIERPEPIRPRGVVTPARAE